MLTFFATAKAFTGPTGMMQRNALQSWKRLAPNIEVILFGDDAGASEVCNQLGLCHEPRVERHPSGMKYLDYMFQRAQQIARHEYLCYSNCDIVLMQDFRSAVERAKAWQKKFLLVARRWDTDVTAPIQFESAAWEQALRQLARNTGKKQSPDFIDFFVFPKGFYSEVPPLVVGRSYWDHWLVWRALNGALPVIDASRFLVAVHQNHGYGYHPLGKHGTIEDELARRNIELCGNGRHLRSMHDASHALMASGRIVRTPFRRQLHTLWELRTKQGWLEHTFWIRKRLGLRRESMRRLMGA